MYNGLQLIDEPIYAINADGRTKRKYSCQVWKAALDNELVFCVYCPEKDYAEIMNYDEKMLQDLIRFASNDNRILECCSTKPKSFFRFYGYNGNHISLKHYVFAKKKNIPLKNAFGKQMRILLKDYSLCEYNLTDIRIENLYNAGGLSEEGIQIIERPNHSEEKYIMIERDGVFAIQEYSDDFDEFVKRRKFGNIHPDFKNERLDWNIYIGTKTNPCFRFAKVKLIYDIFRSNYKTLKRFWKSFSSLIFRFGDEYQCGHINGITWNNCDNNIMRMLGKTNNCMKRFILEFTGMYDVFPIVYRTDGQEVILIELAVNNHHTFWMCDSPDNYLDFQRVLLGKGKLTGKTKLVVNDTEVNTPKQERERISETDEPLTTVKVKSVFWKWCDKRDNLIRLYEACPGAFKPWCPCETGNENYIALITNIGTLANIDASNGIMVVSELDAAG